MPPVVNASLVGDATAGDAGTDRSHLRSHRADAGADASGAGHLDPISEPRSDRPLLPPLRHAVEFGDVTDDERRRFGTVLERHYSLIDETVGRAMAAIGPDDLLLVVSGYGMEPLGFAKRLIERVIGDPDVSGSHEAAPDGFLMAYGGLVARGRGAGARLDCRRDADGPVFPRAADRPRHGRLSPQTDLFQPSFIDERPITYHSHIRPMTLRAGPRALVLLTLVATAGLIAFWATWNRDVDTSRLSWVATAHQFGPVGYRDPAGALSPDGRWIAYSEGRFLRVRSVDGGPAIGLPPGEAQIRNIAWSPDNRTILTDGHRTQTDGRPTHRPLGIEARAGGIARKERRIFDSWPGRPTAGRSRRLPTATSCESCRPRERWCARRRTRTGSHFPPGRLPAKSPVSRPSTADRG